jgi:hypothetical protein
MGEETLYRWKDVAADWLRDGCRGSVSSTDISRSPLVAMDGPDALRRGSLETPVRRWGLALARMLDAWMCDPSQRKKKEQLKKSAMNDVHATNVGDG